MAAGNTGSKASIRSSTPPCPGSRPLLSFTPAARLIIDSNRSPTTPRATSAAVAALVALAAIDADTRLLPDAITQPLAWGGLLAASLGLSGIGLNDALWGAAAGYLFLWSTYWLFKGLTGKDGMGQGDFKLMAALGAWLGWPALLSLVLIASLSGALVGICLKFRGQLSDNGEMAFGPYLVMAGLWVMAFGPVPGLQF